MQILAQMQQIQVLFFRTFWNFFSYIFHVQLFECSHVEPTNVEGQVYYDSTII